MQDLKPLLVFAAVLEYGSMNAAAAALDMTPSAVSQHISRLESIHGIKLLNRSTRSLVPTDAGRALSTYCHQLQNNLSDIRTTLNNLKTEPAGELNIALTSTIIESPSFQTALLRIQTELPKIRPILHISDYLENLDQMDLSIRGGDHALDDPNLVARHLVTWHFQLCASPDYLARHPPIYHPSQLHSHHLIHRSNLQTTLKKDSESYFLELPGYMQCNQLTAIRSLTINGLGISNQVSGEVAKEIAEGRLKAVLPEWTQPAVNLYLVTPYRVQSAKTEAAVKIFLETFAQETSI